MKTHSAKWVPVILVLVLSIEIFSPIGRSAPIGSPVTGIVLPGTLSNGQAFLFGRVDVGSLRALEGPARSGQILPAFTRLAKGGSSSLPDPASTVSTSSIINNLTGTVGLNRLDAAILGCNCNPPDVTVAAGPNHVVEMVNFAGEIFSKGLLSLKKFDLHSFFKVPASDFVFSDPKVLFDASSQRWFASVLNATCTFNVGCSKDTIVLAVSTTSDPTGVWNLFLINSGVLLPDQPIIGVSDDKFVVSGNDFNDSDVTNAPFVGDQYWVLNKNEMVQGLASVHFITMGPDPSIGSAHPVKSLSSTTTQYMISNLVSSQNFQNNGVRFFSITGVPGVSPVKVSNITFSLSTIAQSPLAVAPLGSNIDPGDIRVQDAAWFKGELWFGLNDGCTPQGDTTQRSCIRLTEINTNTSSIAQDFQYGISSQYAFFPALSIDGSGSLGVVYGYSSSTIDASLAVTGQAISDPPNSLAPPKTIKSGETVIGEPRYGDYFGAGVDPSDPSLIWVAGEYYAFGSICGSSFGCWSTFIDSLKVLPVYISSTSPALAISQNSSATSNITLNGINGFTGSVSLAATVSPALSNGPTVNLNPTNVALNSGGSATSKLVMSTAPSTPSGLYTINVTGTSSSQSHSVLIGVAVGPISFDIGAGGVTPSDVFSGVTVRTTGVLSEDFPSNSLTVSGTASIVATNSSTGAAIFAKNYTITRLPLFLYYGRYLGQIILDVAATLYPLGSVVDLTLAGPSATAPGGASVSRFVSRNPDVNGYGRVDLRDLSIVVAANGCNLGSLCYNPRADINADGTIDSVDISIVSGHIGAFDLNQLLFNVTASQRFIRLNAGASGSSSISVNAFVSSPVTVTLTTVSSTGLTASLTPTSVNTPGTSTLSVSASKAGNYMATITGTGSGESHSVTVTVSVVDFSISASPSTLSVARGSSQASTIGLVSLNGFSNTVGLNATITPVVSKGPVASLSSTSIILSSNGSGSSTLTVTATSSTPVGTYVVTIVASSGSLSHSVTVTVTVTKT